MSISEMIDAMKEVLEGTVADAEKADKHNKAAGTRVRKVMQEVAALAKDIRREVLSKR